MCAGPLRLAVSIARPRYTRRIFQVHSPFMQASCSGAFNNNDMNTHSVRTLKHNIQLTAHFNECETEPHQCRVRVHSAAYLYMCEFAKSKFRSFWTQIMIHLFWLYGFDCGNVRKTVCMYVVVVFCIWYAYCIVYACVRGHGATQCSLTQYGIMFISYSIQINAHSSSQQCSLIWR